MKMSAERNAGMQKARERQWLFAIAVAGLGLDVTVVILTAAMLLVMLSDLPSLT